MHRLYSVNTLLGPGSISFMHYKIPALATNKANEYFSFYFAGNLDLKVRPCLLDFSYLIFDDLHTVEAARLVKVLSTEELDYHTS